MTNQQSAEGPERSEDPIGGETLWHGRFESGPSEALLTYTVSLPYDQRLAPYDIMGSRAHVRGLARVDLLTEADAEAVLIALDEVEAELASGNFTFVPSDEDIHTAVERRVTEIAGPAGARLHTGRSRNDQVATDLRLFVKDNMAMIARLVVDLEQVLFDRAVEAGGAYLPGYTHLQRAQPVLLSHHLLAHFWTFRRDVTRLMAARTAADVSPLGAGALAGSTLPLDPDGVAKDLGFSARFENSLDVVSDRDYVADSLYALTMIGIHLSRIGEEFVLWSSEEFGFVTVDDGYATGSSMMPQKKNPDIAELARGKGGRLIGNLTGLLATLKGLPLSYNRDLQEDKEGLFDAIDQIAAGLVAVTGMIATATFRTDAMAKAADESAAGATDLADFLVRAGMPFRDAHAVVANVVRESIDTGKTLAEVTSEAEHLGADAAALLAPGVGIQLRSSPGASGPGPVAIQLESATSALAELKANLP
ncbi:MAG: argininosuccinate lyase [Acidimicrobiaceae bacterium]|jgi:argininosuccinate lyase|nr:argininosuccinate lyase [Acidimicrobiaceae bacterium]